MTVLSFLSLIIVCINEHGRIENPIEKLKCHNLFFLTRNKEKQQTAIVHF